VPTYITNRLLKLQSVPEFFLALEHEQKGAAGFWIIQICVG
jgi:hypothetical protein